MKKSTPAKSSVNANVIAKRMVRRVRPVFKRHASHRKARLRNSTGWRKPRGLHNKQRDCFNGASPMPQSGYQSPEELRGLHASGLAIVRVFTTNDVESIDPKTAGALIAKVGGKRQVLLLQACEKRGVRVLNHKDAAARIELLTSRVKDRHAASETARKAKQVREDASKKAAKKPVDEKVSDEEHKEQEKHIKEEVLTSKGA